MQDRISEIALKRAIFMPSNEIYPLVAGFFDYGPVGAALKRKIENFWRDFLLKRDGYFEIETANILPEEILRASGHIANFVDPIVECKNCHRKYRADHLLEEKAKVKVETLKKEKMIDIIDEMTGTIKEKRVLCPECGGDFGDVGWFNLMFKTNLGPVEGVVGYARPETAQGIFQNFPRIFRAHGAKLPIGIAQIGKSYRNEISPRQGLIRMREFSQMELEYFFDPNEPTHPNFNEVGEQKVKIYTREEQAKGSDNLVELTAKEAVEKKIVPNEIMAYFMVKELQFYQSLGMKYEDLRFRHMLPKETPHYSGGNIDLEVKTSFGWVEVVGNAYRTDYDLKSHSELSGKDLSVLIEERKEKIIPHIVEPSFGVDRTLLCVLEHCYRKGGGAEKRDWEWFDFPARISPYEAAVFPLMKKDKLDEKAKEVAKLLRDNGFDVIYDEAGSIGKRYARADEIGVAYSITIDYNTLRYDDVTIRFRNDGKQIREKIENLQEQLRAFIRENKTCL